MIVGGRWCPGAVEMGMVWPPIMSQVNRADVLALSRHEMDREACYGRGAAVRAVSVR